ncbi:hypothetical protein Tco_0700293, partial [Tanacetum coccineum]
VKISAGFALKKDRKNLARKSIIENLESTSIPDDRYAVSNGSGYAVLISLNEYTVLVRELDTPYPMEVTDMSKINKNKAKLDRTEHEIGRVQEIEAEGEWISKKRMKNKAKTTKPDTEWKSVEETKSRQSPSVKKSTKVNPDKSKVKK